MINGVWSEDPLSNKYRDKSYKLHKQKMAEIAGGGQSSSNRRATAECQQSRAFDLPSKHQSTQQYHQIKKQEEISRQNLKLLERLLVIQEDRQQVSKLRRFQEISEQEKSNNERALSLKRQKQAKLIYQANHVLAERIMNQKSYINCSFDDSQNARRRSKKPKKNINTLPPLVKLNQENLFKEITEEQDNQDQQIRGRMNSNGNTNSQQDQYYNSQNRISSCNNQQSRGNTHFYDGNADIGERRTTVTFQANHNNSYNNQLSQSPQDQLDENNQINRHISLIQSRPQSLTKNYKSHDCESNLAALKKRIQSLRESPKQIISSGNNNNNNSNNQSNTFTFEEYNNPYIKVNRSGVKQAQQ